MSARGRPPPPWDDSMTSPRGGARVTPRAGVVLDGRYLLERPVGRGGMGMVFRATQLNLGRQVAVKVLPTDVMARVEEFEARFRREAMAISRLQHPNIVHVLDYGRDPHFGLYLVMEYLDGRSLDEVMFEDYPLPLRRIADLLIQALGALEAAHAHEIIHRDVKPANLMACDVPGRPDLVKVLDFGVARPLGKGLDRLKLTEDGMVCGTPIYMAPEQATAGQLDGRADVYAVGAVLYEMLAGHLPFDETAPLDYLAVKVSEDPPPPEIMANGERTPPQLLSICMRALARDPGERFADAATFRGALEHWLGRTPRGSPVARADRGRGGRAGGSGADPATVVPPGGPLVEDGPTSPSNRWYAPGNLEDDEATEEDLSGPVSLDVLRGSPPNVTGPVDLLDPPLPPLACPPTDPRIPVSTGYPVVGERLRGRAALLSEIAGAFDAAAQHGWAAWLISGPSGSGRTAVLARTAAQAAAVGWEILPLATCGGDLGPLLGLPELLPVPREPGPRLVLLDDADLLPGTLIRDLLDPTRFADRPTLVLASARRPGVVGGQVQRRQLEPLQREQRRQLVVEALAGSPPPLGGPEVAFPGWLQQRLGLDVERGRLSRAPDGGWRYAQPPGEDSADSAQLAGARLARLDEVQLRLMRALAQAPTGLGHDTMIHLCEVPEQADAAVVELTRMGLMRWGHDRWSTPSLTVAEAGRRGLDEEARAALCVDLASACRRSGQSARGVRRLRLLLEETQFRERAGSPEGAAECLAEVARYAEAVRRPRLRVESLSRAFQVAEGEVAWTTRRIRLAASLAEALVDVGQARQAMATLTGIQLRERLGPVYPALVAGARARALDALDDARADDALEKASRLAGLAREGAIQVRARLALAERALRARDGAAASRHAEQASFTARLESVEPEERGILGVRIAEMLARTGPKGLARRLFEEAVTTSRDAGLPHLAARAGLGVAGLMMERGDRRRAARYLDQARGDPELDPALRARAALNRGLLHTLRRETEEAIQCYRQSLGWAAFAGWRDGVARARRALGER